MSKELTCEHHYYGFCPYCRIKALEEALEQYADRKNWKYTHQYGWATNELGPELAQKTIKGEIAWKNL